MVKIIVVTGSVGSGKTTFAKKLAKKNKAKYIDVNKVISQYNLCESYDNKRKCKVISPPKIASFSITLSITALW